MCWKKTQSFLGTASINQNNLTTENENQKDINKHYMVYFRSNYSSNIINADYGWITVCF